MYQCFLILYLHEAQCVLGDTPPIIRSLKLQLAASGFSYVWGCWTCSWWTLSGSEQHPPTTRPTTSHIWKTRGCQCSFRLLMMGGVSPKTCWASYKYGIKKKLIHCCILFDFPYELYYDARIQEHQVLTNCSMTFVSIQFLAFTLS